MSAQRDLWSAAACCRFCVSSLLEALSEASFRRRKAAASCRIPKSGLFCLAALLFTALALARDFPPEALPPKPLVLPAPALRVLPNGLKVVVIERHLLPILTLRLVVKS